MFNVYKNQPSRQTGSRNLMGPKKEQELIEQFDSPDKIRQILSAFSNIIAKSKETVE
jgi:hypothetical protein